MEKSGGTVVGNATLKPPSLGLTYLVGAIRAYELQDDDATVDVDWSMRPRRTTLQAARLLRECHHSRVVPSPRPDGSPSANSTDPGRPSFCSWEIFWPAMAKSRFSMFAIRRQRRLRRGKRKEILPNLPCFPSRPVLQVYLVLCMTFAFCNPHKAAFSFLVLMGLATHCVPLCTAPNRLRLITVAAILLCLIRAL